MKLSLVSLAIPYTEVVFFWKFFSYFEKNMLNFIKAQQCLIAQIKMNYKPVYNYIITNTTYSVNGALRLMLNKGMKQ